MCVCVGVNKTYVKVVLMMCRLGGLAGYVLCCDGMSMG